MAAHEGILRTAHILKRQHGKAASFVAARRVFELLDLGNVEAAHDWQRIMSAVDRIDDHPWQTGRSSRSRLQPQSRTAA